MSWLVSQTSPTKSLSTSVWEGGGWGQTDRQTDWLRGAGTLLLVVGWNCSYLHGVAELRAAVAGVSHSVLVSVRLHGVGDLGTVVQDVGDP